MQKKVPNVSETPKVCEIFGEEEYKIAALLGLHHSSDCDVVGQFINFKFSLSVQFLKESFLFKNQEIFFRNKYTNMEEISADNAKGSSTSPDKKLALGFEELIQYRARYVLIFQIISETERKLHFSS